MSCTMRRANLVQTAAHPDRATLFVSLELSKSKWLATVLLPGGDKLSKHTVLGGDWDALLALLLRARAQAEARVGKSVQIVAIHEAGLDGFSVHRVLQMNGVESHVVDPASIAVPRRKRRAKSDRIDGETLLRTLLAYKRGEPRVCSMVVPPSPEDEDRRRLSRERRTLVSERVQHTNRIRGMLMAERASRTTIRCAETDASSSTHCVPPMGASCRPTSKRASCARSSGSRSCCARSPRSRRSATRCCDRKRRLVRRGGPGRRARGPLN